MENIIAAATKRGASDVHIVCGIPVRIRVDGQIENMDNCVLTASMCEQYARYFGEDVFRTVQEHGEADMAVTVCQRRLRVNVFNSLKIPRLYRRFQLVLSHTQFLCCHL